MGGLAGSEGLLIYIYFFKSMLAVIKSCEVKYSSSSCVDEIEPLQDNRGEVNVHLQLA